MGSGTDRRYHLNDLPGITPRSGIGAMRGIVMMLAASLLVTANVALVKLALGAAGSALSLFFRGLFAPLALLIYAAISGQFGCLLTRCWRLSVGLAGFAVLELDWAWFELRDRGLLDFTASELPISISTMQRPREM